MTRIEFDGSQPLHRTLALMLTALASTGHRVHKVNISSYMTRAWPADLGTPGRLPAIERPNNEERALLLMQLRCLNTAEFMALCNVCPVAGRVEELTVREYQAIDPGITLHAGRFTYGQRSCLFVILVSGDILTMGEQYEDFAPRSTCAV